MSAVTGAVLAGRQHDASGQRRQPIDMLTGQATSELMTGELSRAHAGHG